MPRREESPIHYSPYDPEAGAAGSNHLAEYGHVRPDRELGYRFQGAGRGAKFDAEGNILTNANREIIVVSPDRDPVLKKAIEEAKTSLSQIPSHEEKVKYIADYVDSLMKEKNAAKNEQILERIVGGPTEGKKVSLGQLIENGTGVCRHRSLLFKAIADEIGMPSSVTKGSYIHNDGTKENHQWNKVELPNGKDLIVDTMSKSEKVIGMGHPRVNIYRDINGKPLYQDAYSIQNALTSKSKSGDVITYKVSENGVDFGAIAIRGSAEELGDLKKALNKEGIKTAEVRTDSTIGNYLSISNRRDFRERFEFESVSVYPQVRTLQEKITNKSASGDVVSYNTNKGTTLLIRGNTKELKGFEDQFAKIGIKTEIGSDARLGEYIRLKSDSVREFHILFDVKPVPITEAISKAEAMSKNPDATPNKGGIKAAIEDGKGLLKKAFKLFPGVAIVAVAPEVFAKTPEIADDRTASVQEKLVSFGHNFLRGGADITLGAIGGTAAQEGLEKAAMAMGAKKELLIPLDREGLGIKNRDDVAQLKQDAGNYRENFGKPKEIMSDVKFAKAMQEAKDKGLTGKDYKPVESDQNMKPVVIAQKAPQVSSDKSMLIN